MYMYVCISFVSLAVIFFFARFEGYGFANSGSGRLSPGLAEQGSIIRVKDLVYWHEGYLAALDCYIWSSNAQLVKPAKIFESKLFELASEFRRGTGRKFILNDVALFPLRKLVLY